MRHIFMSSDRTTKRGQMANAAQERVTPLRQAAQLKGLQRESIRELYARRRKEAEAYAKRETQPGAGAREDSEAI